MSDNKVLDMAVVQKEVRYFWKTIIENREMIFNNQKNKNTTSGSQGSRGGERKENRKRKRKKKGRIKEIENISNMIKERKKDTENTLIKEKKKEIEIVSNVNCMKGGMVLLQVWSDWPPA